MFAVAAALLACADAPQAVVDLVDDIGQPQEVLLDSLKAAEGFDLLGLESADAGRFFEDHTPLSRRGLEEEDVDLALLDDAVRPAFPSPCRRAGREYRGDGRAAD